MTVKGCLNEKIKLTLMHERWQAALTFCQAIKMDSNLLEAYQILGEVLIPLEDWDNAQACFCKVIELDPEFSEVYNHLGVVLKHNA